ncbi:MAG: aminoacyl-tRNA hydrolase [Candidatus Krumholzibacteria bacterium]|nr:aminoacyl-tRNA hydrolase [Candidatus Krumholzibacteria bacterium]
MATNLIVCGLGNPGPEYTDTRHNLGFWVTDLLRERYRGRWRRPCDLYVESRVRIAGKPISLVKPLTYMNLSGDALRLLTGSEEFDPTDLLVVCDDTALPLGRIRLRKKGSDGGHNGLQSIIEALGTREFARLRLGVGSAPEETDQADFVLSVFPAGLVEPAREMVARAAECVEAWVAEGTNAAMNRFNVQPGDSSSEETD